MRFVKGKSEEAMMSSVWFWRCRIDSSYRKIFFGFVWNGNLCYHVVDLLQCSVLCGLVGS